MLNKHFIVLIFTLFLSSCSIETPTPSLCVSTAYGDFTVTEPVLIDLFASSAMKRLKSIRQYGSNDYVAGDPHYSRYEHSVGVWALLRHYGASLNEQIAGLLHDASHTVFSHVGDHVFGESTLENSYQDDIHAWYLEQQGVDAIIKPYGITLNDINPKQESFTRLERNLPDLCADRIEYNFKAGVLCGFFEKHDIKKLMADLSFDGKQQLWYFKTVEGAKLFSLVPIYNSLHVWGGPESFVMNTLAARMLKRAMECNLLTRHDVHFSTDDVVWKTLCASDDTVIQETLYALKHYAIAFTLSTPELCHYTIRTKFRGYNPWVKTDSGYARLTELDSDFCAIYNGSKKVTAQGWPVRWIQPELFTQCTP